MTAHVRAIILAMKRETTTSEVPTNPTVRRAWIGFQLRIRGLSGRAVALQEGVSQQAFSAAMIGGGSSHLQEVVAQLLDLTPPQLFPELYDASGRRLLNTRPPNRTTRREGGNGKNEEAA